MKIVPVVGCVAVVLGTGAAQGYAQDDINLESGVPGASGRDLSGRGKFREAFIAFAKTPGQAADAVALGRKSPQAYLDLVREKAADAPGANFSLIEGDLLLALGRKTEALAAYRRAAAKLEAQGDKPARLQGYPVEQPVKTARDTYAPNQGLSNPVEPASFQSGSGSHRDNWLIRRFISLDAWDDAAKEFARVWEIHRGRTKAFLTTVQVWKADPNERPEEKLFRAFPAGFDDRGLQFAVDYAYFLKKRGKQGAALAVLMEPVSRLDFDKASGALRLEKAPEGASAADAVREPGRDLYSSRGRGQVELSRQDFIRIAQGEFKNAGKEGEFAAALQKQVDGGDNRARRVLAGVKLHQGREDEALKLELAYIQNGEFDALSAAVRRGNIYEEYHKGAEAAAQYEAALAMPYHRQDLPEVEVLNVYQQRLMMPLAENGEEARFRAAYLQRLVRLYSGLNQNGKVLECSLRQLEADSYGMERLETLEGTKARFATAGQEKRFLDWAKERRARNPSPAVKANLNWVLGDVPGTLALVVTFTGYEGQQWERRFSDGGPETQRQFFAAMASAKPKDGRSRLYLLKLDNKLSGPELTQAYELLLEQYVGFWGKGGMPMEDVFANRGEYSRTKFNGVFDLAYRLMRIYEKNGELDKLRGLGLRIALQEKPFGVLKTGDSYGRDWNDGAEYAEACLSLLMQYADDGTRAKLAEALPKTYADGMKAQFARMEATAKGASWPAAVARPRWANLPGGVTAVASAENVLSLCRSDSQFFAGTPWGVAVYDFDGKPITRVALGAAVQHMAVAGKTLWAGTPDGLFRIELPSGKVSKLNLTPVDGETPGVSALAVQGQTLWIGTRRDLRVYNTATGTMRIHSADSMGYEFGVDVTRIMFDGKYVWVGGQVCRRLDTVTGQWKGPKSSGQREPVSLIGLEGGNVWGNVWLNDKLRNRPCIIDRETLKVTPILIEGTSEQAGVLINQPLSICGRYDGQPVFCSDSGYYWFDNALGRLRSLSPKDETTRKITSEAIVSSIPGELRQGRIWRRPDGGIVCDDDITDEHAIGGERFIVDDWCLISLPDGTRVVGGSFPRTPRYQYHEEQPYDPFAEENQAGTGGLRLIGKDGKCKWVTALGPINSPFGATVFAAVPEPGANRVWLCTDFGLTLVDSSGAVITNLTRSDGVPSNRITSGAASGGKLYFGARWGDSGGGFIVYDPVKRLFSTLNQWEGLASNAVERISAVDGRLKLEFGLQYRRSSDFKYQRYEPEAFDPRTGTFGAVAPPKIFASEEQGLIPRGNGLGTVPYLGGMVLSRVVIGDKTWICGTRGLVIVPNEAQPMNAKPVILQAKIVSDGREAQLADARRRPVDIKSVPALAAALKELNPLYRANALASLLGEDKLLADPQVLTLAGGQLNRAEMRLRATALYIVSICKDRPAAVPFIKTRLQDSDDIVRAAATVYFAEHGQVPPTENLEEMLVKQAPIGNLAFGADSSIGSVGEDQLTEAIAPIANVAVFKVLLQKPPSVEAYSYNGTVFPALAAALRRNPGAAAVLLQAHDDQSYDVTRRDFAQELFRRAGKPMLPVLHKALLGTDRVACSNAARAAGAIKDPSSIPTLIKALNLESGLSRASVVWALGELKAKQAIPNLTKLYLDVSSQGGSGAFLAGQATTGFPGQYLVNNLKQISLGQIDELRNLDDVSASWDELKASAQPAELNVRRDEELLKTEHILEAFRKIGGVGLQDFYRTLAGSKSPEARKEAAARLAEGAPQDAAKNASILVNLLHDNSQEAVIAAATSLLIIGKPEQRKPAEVEILRCLSSANFLLSTALEELARVKDPRRLDFARAKLREIAADTRREEWARTKAAELI